MKNKNLEEKVNDFIDQWENDCGGPSVMKEYDNHRQRENRKLLNIIENEINLNPSMRFNQILVNLGFTSTENVPIDMGHHYNIFERYETLDYNEEPWETNKRIEQRFLEQLKRGE